MIGSESCGFVGGFGLKFGVGNGLQLVSVCDQLGVKKQTKSCAQGKVRMATDLKGHDVNGLSISEAGLQPIGLNILVELDEKQNVTKKGIILAGNVQKKRRSGTIRAVGQGSRFVKTGVEMPMPLKAGDRVVFGVTGEHRGLQLKYDGKPCVIVTLDDVLGVLKSEDPASDLSEINPIADKILIHVHKQELSTPGGLVLNASKDRRVRTGEVIAVGNGKLLEDGSREPIGVEVGEQVMWNEYAGNELQALSSEEKYVVIRARDLAGAW
uniref:20 kDa chaperonin, chloroplastic n=1 Tax=Timspurckia oligopyrenoides TaxID=708627 RepID=A0A7S0ZI90_9RHOD|mmetsp:Transcript_6422/g.11432  ORF Transcript_6422/g.11432 Transcript_6422/m.11432 type:complete len:268 (+) Transcript_6422:69-872(+)|eukprot:CAMPEP_0182445524 /NCGR_PEP_ID=MMETSP1172-20130603/3620_1 /TAXON_ID=708627 /ORGANISM="Timspurckia oligopyrenoides, Strain CCMP3278" /LENGTH=267 /DNA_ID=CAMNT_0024641313 /DNA_START=55 /DNA_END=858 /DNA_ORIENTATION=+